MFPVITKAVIDGHSGVVNIDIGPPTGKTQTAHVMHRVEPTEENDHHAEWVTLYKNDAGEVVEVEFGGFEIPSLAIPYLQKSQATHED